MVRIPPKDNKEPICLCGHGKVAHKLKTKYNQPCKDELCECIKYREAKFPPFVLLGDIALRLIQNGWHPCYYRDAGAWEIRFSREYDKVRAIVPKYFHPNLQRINGKVLIPCTRKQWEDSNVGYTHYI